MSKILAVIPARQGSKRLAGKNIMPLMGKPMIAWTIEAALASGIFSDVLVATDGKEIAGVARRCGVAVPFLRSKKDADDHTPVSVATLNALLRMEKEKGASYNTVIQLMPNCPCRTAEDIKEACAQFEGAKAAFQISVFKFGWMNPWWALRKAKDGTAEPLFPAALKKRSQDLEALYCPTGAIWIANAAALKKEKTFYGKNYRIHPMHWENAVDIDDEQDLRMAETILSKRKSLAGMTKG